MGSHLLHLSLSLRVSRLKSLTTCFPDPIRRYSLISKANETLSNPEDPTETVEKLDKEIEEVNELNESKTGQGFASQTTEKLQDGSVELTVGEATDESVKEKFTDQVDTGDFHKTGDNDDKGVLER